MVSFLVSSKESNLKSNIYANKSATVLYWLIYQGLCRNRIYENDFSIRKVAGECDVSVGLVQRIFKELIKKGVLKTEGVRTAKKFLFNRPAILLEEWVHKYNITSKCRIHNFSMPFNTKEEFFKLIKKHKFEKSVCLALHSAVEAYGFKNTNLQTIELYVHPEKIEQIQKKLFLEPRDKGYEVILIEPYYKEILNHYSGSVKYCNMNVSVAPLLLAYLDLYNFPLRGIEQAEFIRQKVSMFKKIFDKEGNAN